MTCCFFTPTFRTLSHLPEPIIPVVKVGIEQYLRGEMYGEFECL
jgi:hypothetical protein